MWFLDRHRSILIFLILLLGIAWFFLLGLGIYGALAAELNEKLDYLRFAIGISTFGVTIYALYYSSVSSSYLRSAFGLGLWRGYSRNFLDRVVRSFQDQGERPPFLSLRLHPTRLSEASIFQLFWRHICQPPSNLEAIR